MTLALALTDNADATGLTATVTGSAGGAVGVYAMPMAAGAAFYPVATRTGSGVLALPLPPRLYWLYAAEAAAVTAVQGAAATNGLDKPPTRCRNAVAAKIAALGLTNPTGGLPLKVYQQIYPDATGVLFPCVILSVEGSTETTGPTGTTETDDRGYPVKVMLADRQGTPPDHRILPAYERWRFAIERAFDGQFLDGVPESGTCAVEPYLIADPLLPQYQMFVSGMLIRCFCRTARGAGV